jgi:hypothetical protein
MWYSKWPSGNSDPAVLVIDMGSNAGGGGDRSLPAEYRIVAARFRLEECSSQGIADMMACPVGTLHSSAALARANTAKNSLVDGGRSGCSGGSLPW